MAATPPSVAEIPQTRDLLVVLATFAVVSIIVVLVGAAADASVATLAMVIGAAAAFWQYRRRVGPRPPGPPDPGS
ncbi:MAG: hypothetical protein ACK5OX_00165 [Desertimonas sp.]